MSAILKVSTYMTATAHALVGGVIAASVPNPALGITLAFASHPLLDLIPHWDFGWGWRKKSKPLLFIQASFDFILGLILTYLLFIQYPLFGISIDPGYLLACVIASVIWDVAEIPYWFLNWDFPPFSWIYKIQSKMQGKTKTMFMGIVTQVVTVSILVLILQRTH